jgi:ribosomal protein S4
MIIHKKILVDGKVVNAPSFVVSTELENKITLFPKKIKAEKKEEKQEE